MKLLWLSPVDTKIIHNRSQPTSLAAAKWNISTVSGLRASGCSVQQIGHVPYRSFPSGDFWIKTNKIGKASSQTTTISYPNLRYFREVWLLLMYRKKVAEALKMGGADVLVLYNTQPHSLRAATEAEKRKTPVVLIAADQDDMKGPWEEYTTRVPSHWGNIFLSWRMNLECPYVKKIQWDGGIEPRSVSNRRRWKSDGVLRLVYSGTGAEAGGVKSLIDSIKYLKGENVHLTLTGPNYSKELLTRINHDPRIEYAGLLGEGQLAELFLEVDVLVNPRSPDLAENRYNFPSKILEYLSWEKLVLSTQTDGIAPHYLDGLIKTRGGSPSDIADSITQIYKWDHEKHGMYVAKAVAIKKQYTKRSAIYHLKNFLEGMLELSVR